MPRFVSHFAKVGLQGVAVYDVQPFRSKGFEFFHNGYTAVVHFHNGQVFGGGTENGTGQSAGAGADFKDFGIAKIRQILFF